MGGVAHPVSDLARYLAGDWRLDRSIVGAGERDGEPIGSFEGTATFIDGGDGALHYRERGVLRIGEHAGDAHRELAYLITGPGQAEVRFETGGHFHHVDLRTGRWRTSHPCRADRYDGEYEVMGPDSWRLQWTVTGPAKAYRMETGFRRMAAEEPR